MTLCNMVVEAGGKNGFVPADATTFKYLEGKTTKPYQTVTSDGNARYIELSKLCIFILSCFTNTNGLYVDDLIC